MKLCICEKDEYGECADKYGQYEGYFLLKDCISDIVYHFEKLKLINHRKTVNHKPYQKIN